MINKVWYIVIASLYALYESVRAILEYQVYVRVDVYPDV
jgi:hypothetical protein